MFVHESHLAQPSGVGRSGVFVVVGVRATGVATFGVPMGRIAVLSSRFFFGFGSGATGEISTAIISYSKDRALTLIVLLHVKFAQQHDGLFSEDSSVCRKRSIDAVVCVDVHHAATATEAIIQAAEVHGTDAVLSQGGGAHDAWLDSHVQICVADDGLSVLGHDFGQSDEFGVTGSLMRC